jgi:hypothetical protein
VTASLDPTSSLDALLAELAAAESLPPSPRLDDLLTEGYGRALAFEAERRRMRRRLRDLAADEDAPTERAEEVLTLVRDEARLAEVEQNLRIALERARSRRFVRRR